MRSKRRLEVAPQVSDFLRRLAPEPRRSLRHDINGLAHRVGNVRPLEGKLAGYYRLRSGSHRVILVFRAKGGTETVSCVFAEHRSIVYEVFTQLLLSKSS